MIGIAASLLIFVTQSAPVTLDAVRDLAARGDIKAAREAGERLIQITPQDGEAWYVLGVIRAASEDAPGALAAYRNAIQHAPRHLDAWNNLGDLLRRSGKTKDALEPLNKALALAPKHPRVSLNLALVNIELKDFEKALTYVGDAEAGMGRNTIFDYLRAKVYVETGQVSTAMPYIESFRKATPQSPGAFLDLAKLLLARGEYETVLELLLALQPDRQEPNTQFVLGQAWYATDQMQKARDVFERLVAQHPENALYATWKGHAEHALGAVENARSAYEKAIRLDGSSAEALTELANLELDAGRSEQAEALASRALSLSPDDSRAQFVAGLVWSRMQRWNDAVRVLERIAAREPEYAQAQYVLSRAYRQLGSTAKAEAALNEFKKASSTGDIAAPGRRRVR